MTKRETELLRVARAMFSAIMAQSYGDVMDFIDCLEIPAEDVDAALHAYDKS